MWSAVLLALSSSVMAQQTLSGLDIATEMVNRDSGYLSYTADVQMKISASNGDTVTHQLMIKGIEQENDGDKIVTY
ncbi:malate transporter, partial [Vibrio cholerae]|nr:malate transporter [Vibrio cholerae]